MDPIRMTAAIDESINHLNQISCTLELVLTYIFECDAIDLNGSEAEIVAAMEICKQYPAWRAVLTHVWEALITERDALTDLAFRGRGTVA